VCAAGRGSVRGGGADGEAQADGQPLLQLPQKTIELVRIEFSKEEREVRVPPARTHAHALMLYRRSTTQ
jgi:hypothetical protein